MPAITPYLIASPKGTAALGQYLQTELAARLPWLKYAFGAADRVTVATGTDAAKQRTEYRAAVWTGDGTKYDDMQPRAERGSFVFSYFDSPTAYQAKDPGRLRAGVNLVFFVALADLGPGNLRNVADAVADIVGALASMPGLNGISELQVFDKFEQVYSNYSYKEGDYLTANTARRAVLRVRFETTYKTC